MTSLDVWVIDLTRAFPPGDWTDWLTCLDAEERRRACAFRFPLDARRYTLSHVALRHILARSSGQPPEALHFARNAFGKPSLVGHGEGIAFNLSHSGELALCAVADSGEIGVDVEQQRGLELEDLAERFFNPAEYQALIALPPGQREPAFFACWTRKEAYIKARGLGLSLALDQFRVDFAQDRPAALLYSDHEPADVSRCGFWDIPVPAGYRAALAWCAPSVPANGRTAKPRLHEYFH